MSLSQVINVTVTANTSAVQQAAFGIPLFCFAVGNKSLDTIDFGEGNDGIAQARENRTFVITSLNDLPDSLDSTTEAYKAASAYFSQSPAVNQMVLCKFWQTDTVGLSPDANRGEAIVASEEENSDWYVATSDTNIINADADDLPRDTAILEIATAVGGLKGDSGTGKLYFVSDNREENYSTAYTGASTAGDILGKLRDNASDRVISFYHHLPYADCAFAGHNLPYTAGSATWAYLSLNGFGAAKNEAGTRNLNNTQLNNLYSNSTTEGGRNANTVEAIAGQFVTREGKTTAGEWIDVVRGIDALDEAMTKNLFTLMINQKGKKIPYTNTGINQVRGVMQDVLNQFVNSNFIESNFVITLPDANDVSFSDKANRDLLNCRFTAYLTGAIHYIEVTGEVTFPT